jgi:hypothetical protein
MLVRGYEQVSPIFPQSLASTNARLCLRGVPSGWTLAKPGFWRGRSTGILFEDITQDMDAVCPGMVAVKKVKETVS